MFKTRSAAIKPYLTQSATKERPNTSSFAQRLANVRNPLNTLSAWAALKPDVVLVHSLRSQKSLLFQKPAEEVFSQWDMISTSLVNVKNIAPFPKQWEPGVDTDRVTGCFDDVSLVLDVAPQNIIGTHHKDVWFPNHAGVSRSGKVRNSYALADRVRSGIGKHRKVVQGGFDQLVTPDTLLRPSRDDFNEVLIVGREGVNTYTDLKPTQNVKVVGILVAPKHKSGEASVELRDSMQRTKMIAALQELNAALRNVTVIA